MADVAAATLHQKQSDIVHTCILPCAIDLKLIEAP